MTIDLDTLIASLKSARVITDPDEIMKVMKRRADGSGPLVSLDEEGHVRVRKAVRTKGLDGMPKPNPSKYASLAADVGIEWQEGYEERVVAYWGSDERVDSHGDIVRQNWKFDLFEDNPVMPFSHEWGGKPIGNAIDWGVANRKSKGYDGPALWLLGLFATADMNEEAESVFRLVKGGFLRGGSVGFRSGKVIEITDEEERQKLGLGRWGAILDENMLLEFSPTTLGANAGAMAVLASAGRGSVIEARDIDTARELYRREIHGRKNDKAEWARIEKMVLEVAARVFPDEEFEPHAELDTPIGEKGEGAEGGTPPADGDDETNTSTVLARLDRIEDMIVALSASHEAMTDETRAGINDVRELVESVRDRIDIKDIEGDDEVLDPDQEKKLDRVLETFAVD